MQSTRKIILISLIFSLVAMAAVAFIIMRGADTTPEASTDSSETAEDDNPPWAIIIPIMVVVIGLSFLPFFKIFFPGTIKNGIKAEATVMKVWDTGVSINDNPQVGMLLDVRPSMGAAFQAEAKKIVSRLNTGIIQPGVKVQVLYDPANPKRLEVQTIQGSVENPSTIETRLRELQNLREKDLITLGEYEKKREEILKTL